MNELVQREVAPAAYWEAPNHLRVFSREELDRLIEDSGLRIEGRRHGSFY